VAPWQHIVRDDWRRDSDNQSRDSDGTLAAVVADDDLVVAVLPADRAMAYVNGHPQQRPRHGPY
jgi:hypothetical protein